MRYVVFLLLFLVTTASFTFEEEKLAWNEDIRLTWKDFKGVPNPGNGFVASTNSGVSFSFSYSERNGVGTVDYTVVANFYPQLSWYLSEKVDDYILLHEQTHFDITELHARKLREALAKLPQNRAFKEEAEVAYNAMEAARREMQEAYDLQTDHSNIKEAEYRWRSFVKEQLDSYQAWK